MNEEKIKKLLKLYGADENEIKNFMEDLAQDIKEIAQDKVEEKIEEIKENKETFDDDYDFENWNK